MILQNTFQLTNKPKRIISLVPSQTSLLYALNLNDAVIGITKFCTEPPHWKKEKKMIGGTKNPNIALIKSLNPDLIIANKEENRKEDIELLAQEFPVWITDVYDLPSALNMIVDIGVLTQQIEQAQVLKRQIEDSFEQLNDAISLNNIPSAYLIWKDPWMTVGGDTFIHHMMQYAGFKNLFEEDQRYPIININKLKEKNCQLLLLSSEPYPFTNKHILELTEELPDCQIILVDGMKFSWYGDQLLSTPAYLLSLLEKIRPV